MCLNGGRGACALRHVPHDIPAAEEAQGHHQRQPPKAQRDPETDPTATVLSPEAEEDADGKSLIE